MGKAILNAAVSLDGFVADDDDGVGPLFDWYGNGEVPVSWAGSDHVFHVSPGSAEYIAQIRDVGAVVAGRRVFDLTDGWDGVPPAGDHVFVVTHAPPTDWGFPDAPFTFVTDGVASAVEQARAVAGDRDVSVAAGDVGAQALEAGVIDEVHLNLVPVVFGSGKPFFGSLGAAQILLENPRVIEGDRVVHLLYSVA